ncbi:glycerol-3-phosphate acyltransferase [Croceibacterium mercuriale]|uniref:Glycerol-3-phosphate acyltransferase n=1 Tax=Croceibacterium mercuriale TaxID=1572751 RepID=A0A0B2BWY0_9SPHN|nr:glycerol-3-phosphate 1-O-acyltransferase PlsY [Croceibacterium mercuriale]KHL26123.1 glycerol-3-phosphate acyltransferase [Croceibacterium mercuriale]
MTLPIGTTALLALLLGYAIGSIPFGLLLVRAAGKGDVRDVGSGNIGATNVLRAAGKGIAAATLVLDALKGWVAILLAVMLWGAGQDWAALGAFLGHCFPVWLRFKGGKGVATLIGIGLGLHWTIGLTVIVVWLGVARLSRISSVGGMAAAAAAPLAALAFGHTIYLPVLLAIFAIVLLRHRANIARLLAGTEPRIGRKR